MSDPVRFHLSLNVSDLTRSVAFFRTLFELEPAKLRADYAKFEANDPPLVLSLEPAREVGRGGALNHLERKFRQPKRRSGCGERLVVQRPLLRRFPHADRERGLPFATRRLDEGRRDGRKAAGYAQQ